MESIARFINQVLDEEYKHLFRPSYYDTITLTEPKMIGEDEIREALCLDDYYESTLPSNTHSPRDNKSEIAKLQYRLLKDPEANPYAVWGVIADWIRAGGKRMDEILEALGNQVDAQIAKLTDPKQLERKLTDLQFLDQVITRGRPPRLGKVTRKSYDEYYSKSWYGVITISDWYRECVDRWTTVDREREALSRRASKAERAKQKAAERPLAVGDIAYPFRSKFKQFHRANSDVPFEETAVDNRMPKKLLSRPYYSPCPGGWEIDRCFNMCVPGDSWLFCININTRFLVVYAIPEKAASVLGALKDLLSNHPVASIRGDGSSAYNSMELRRWYSTNRINTFFNSGKFTYYNKIVDVVTKTIRYAIGYRRITTEQMDRLVYYYNHTVHKAIGVTPEEMSLDRDLEYRYIRYCDQRLLEVKRCQRFNGLLDYSPGNVLAVHVDLSKTSNKNGKRRRNFDLCVT